MGLRPDFGASKAVALPVFETAELMPFGPPDRLSSAGALLHESHEGRTRPFPGRTYPVTSVMGVPSAVKPFRTAIRTWNSAT